MEDWYAFRAYNSQTLYGFGTSADADRYCDRLNKGREVNLYGARLMTDDDIANVPHLADEGCNLDDELAYPSSEG